MEGTPFESISAQLSTPVVKEDLLSQWAIVFLALLAAVVVRILFVVVATLIASKKPLTLCRSVTLSVLALGSFLLRERRNRQVCIKDYTVCGESGREGSNVPHLRKSCCVELLALKNS